MRKTHFLLTIIVVLSLLCVLFGFTRTFHIEVSEIGDYPQPLMNPLVLDVGVYYADEFGKFKTTERIEFPNTSIVYVEHIQLGKANIALFNYILSHVFESVTVINKPDYASKSSDKLDLFIVPEVGSFTYHGPTEKNISISIAYTINFFSSDGELLMAWEIEGRGEVIPEIELKKEATAVMELTKMAMRQVAAKFMTGFCKQEKINQLFHEHCTP